jgi:hypothetical protein
VTPRAPLAPPSLPNPPTGPAKTSAIGEGGAVSYSCGYSTNYSTASCSEPGSRPRQHWGLALPPSLTTRPPRRNTDGRGSGSQTRSCAWFRDWRGRTQSETKTQPRITERTAKQEKGPPSQCSRVRRFC